MKKYTIIAISIFIVMIIVFVCVHHTTQKKQLHSLLFSSEHLLYECSQKESTQRLDYDVSKLSEYHLFIPLSNIEYETIFIAQCEASEVETLQEVMQQYHKQLETSFKEDALAIRSHYYEANFASYYVVVISEKGDTIMEEIKARLDG